MQNKLQELTDKLYNEGLSKGKQEGEELLAKAKVQADDIIAKAQAEAERIIAAAQKQAEEIKTKTASDVKMAASQSIAATKKDIETLVVLQLLTKHLNFLYRSNSFGINRKYHNRIRYQKPHNIRYQLRQCIHHCASYVRNSDPYFQLT